LEVRRAETVSRDAADTRATVAVAVVESGAGPPKEYSGTWSLVRGPSGWLLDQSNLEVK
jgi:hypothetical protein